MNPHDLPPCVAHGERACGRCYHVIATDEQLEAVIGIYAEAEAAGILPEKSAATERAYHHRHWPRLFTLRVVLGGLHRRLSAKEHEARARILRRIDDLAGQLEEQLLAAGQTTTPTTGAAP